MLRETLLILAITLFHFKLRPLTSLFRVNILLQTPSQDLIFIHKRDVQLQAKKR
jgi:hypothetical protein